MALLFEVDTLHQHERAFFAVTEFLVPNATADQIGPVAIMAFGLTIVFAGVLSRAESNFSVKIWQVGAFFGALAGTIVLVFAAIASLFFFDQDVRDGFEENNVVLVSDSSYSCGEERLFQWVKDDEYYTGVLSIQKDGDNCKVTLTPYEKVED